MPGVAVCLAAGGRHSAKQDGADEIVDPIEAPAIPPRAPYHHSARVYFITPVYGDTVCRPIRIQPGNQSMSVTKSGDNQPGSGHHHILIDGDLPGPGKPAPASANCVQLGYGRISAESTLEPGQHTRRMLLGYHGHIPHDLPLFC